MTQNQNREYDSYYGKNSMVKTKVHNSILTGQLYEKEYNTHSQ